MKRTTKIGLLTAGAAALGLAATLAIAHPGGGGMAPGAGMGQGMMGQGMMGMGPGQRMGPGAMGPQAMQGGDFATAIEPRLAAAKAELKISAEQEPAWQAYVAQTKARFETMQASRATMHSAAPGSAAERIDQHAAMMKQHAAVAEETGKAVKALYAVLTPEQRALADQRLFAMGPGRGMGPQGRMR